jgi:hypothetical protein
MSTASSRSTGTASTRVTSSRTSRSRCTLRQVSQ